MINYFSNQWSHFLEWKEECIEESAAWVKNHAWTLYAKERALVEGLPFAMITAVAGAYLFNCASPGSALIYGTVNYITLTSMAEFFRIGHRIDQYKALALMGVAGAISVAFMKTVCKISMTYQTAIVLSVASLAGQAVRDYLIGHKYD